MPLPSHGSVTGLDGEVDSLIGYRSPVQAAPAARLTVSRAEEFSLLTERIGPAIRRHEPHAIGVAAQSAALVRRHAGAAARGHRDSLAERAGRCKAVRAGTMR